MISNKNIKIIEKILSNFIFTTLSFVLSFTRSFFGLELFGFRLGELFGSKNNEMTGFIKSLSFIMNKKIAYLPDANEIYAKDYKKFMNLKYLVIDCLRHKTHPSHFNLDDVLELNILFKPKKMILTNLHSDLDYDKLMNILPKNVKPAYDGLTLDF